MENTTIRKSANTRLADRLNWLQTAGIVAEWTTFTDPNAKQLFYRITTTKRGFERHGTPLIIGPLGYVNQKLAEYAFSAE